MAQNKNKKMAQMDVKKTVLLYAGVAFILLGVLFGMNIMTFIFGSLDADTAGFAQTTGVSTNESTGGINLTGYTVDNTSLPSPGTFVITDAWDTNATGWVLNIGAGNVTIDAAGVARNATKIATLYTLDGTFGSNATISYTVNYNKPGTARYVALQVQNDSLNSIETYANNSDTQFSTISIAIILAILISLFVLFWVYFMGSENVGKTNEGSFS